MLPHDSKGLNNSTAVQKFFWIAIKFITNVGKYKDVDSNACRACHSMGPGNVDRLLSLSSLIYCRTDWSSSAWHRQVFYLCGGTPQLLRRKNIWPRLKEGEIQFEQIEKNHLKKNVVWNTATAQKPESPGTPRNTLFKSQNIFLYYYHNLFFAN